MKELKQNDLQVIYAGAISEQEGFYAALFITSLIGLVVGGICTALTRTPAHAHIENSNDAKLFAQYVAKHRGSNFPIFSQDELR